MSTFKENGIYYTIQDGHACVGDLQKAGIPKAVDTCPTTIVIPSRIKDYDVTEILQYSFYNCKSLVKLEIPNSIVKIHDSAFDVCDVPEPLILPAHIKHIGTRAFAGGLYNSVDLPETVEYLGSSPFGNSPNLKAISINSNNKHYMVTSDGCIYDTMKTVLVQTPDRICNITFEPTLVEIGFYTFSNALIETLVFPVTFSKIAEAALNDCQNLVNITFLGNLYSVHKNAFQGCPNLQNVYYYGTKHVSINIFQTTPTKIHVCTGYRDSKFATHPVISSGICPFMNIEKICSKQLHSISVITFSFVIFQISLK